jgi:propanol-preferring alcohol dehydrogenase
MEAAVVRAFGEPLSVVEMDVPTPGFGEAVVKLSASGVCHTDLHAAHGHWPFKPTLPFIPGHEGVGEVAFVGRGVQSVREGDHVGVSLVYSSCGMCNFVRATVKCYVRRLN